MKKVKPQPYKPLTLKDFQAVCDKLNSEYVKPITQQIIVGGLGYLHFTLMSKYPKYGFYYYYHKRIKVYEFRFYKEYKQNVEFREYYNSKYERINYGR